jgi:DNA mismatch repair protein MutL
MSQTIQILSEETINKIAAGEVIEDPASVVKELFENGVDAGASRIIVELQGGGFQKIGVTDNGKGMSHKDLPRCLERHATSKIRIAEDLSSILSMGFRGEALASIAAISKLSIKTCQEEKGYELYAEGGTILSLKRIARNPGTTVEVFSLFYNVPARKKFQKSSGRTQTEIVKMLTRLALANPLLEVKCIADRKEIFSSFMKRVKKRKEMTDQVIEKVLGEQFLEGSSTVYFQDKGCSLLGVVGASYKTRKNRMGQYLFVNGRAVQSPEISRAIYEGYGTRLPSHEHPTFVLHLTLPTEWVDVNVHPQKKEIRLHETSAIMEVVRKGVFAAFQTDESSPPFELIEKENRWGTDVSFPLEFRETAEEKKEAEPQMLFNHIPIVGMYAHYLFLDAGQIDLPIGGSEGIFLIDLELAEARLIFERLLDRFENEGPMQNLLFPVTFECSQAEEQTIVLHLISLQKLGIGIRLFGNQTFVVDSLDPHFQEQSIPKLIFELLEVFTQFDDQKFLEKEKKKTLALRALRFARSEKRVYTEEEGRAIVKQLLLCGPVYESPTGKPLCVYLGNDDLKKYFR